MGISIDSSAPRVQTDVQTQEVKFEPPKPPPPPPPPPPQPRQVRDGFDAAPVKTGPVARPPGTPGAGLASIQDTLNGIPDDKAFCQAAGQLLLGRDMEKGAIDGWMQGLANGVPRSEIIKLIVTSDEFKARVAEQLTPNRSGLKGSIDGLNVTIPEGWEKFGRLDYDPRTVTANGGPSKIPDLMWKMAPYVNLMMVENPLKFESERRIGSPAFKQAYELGRSMEDEFSAAGTYQSPEKFLGVARQRLEQLASIRSRMDPKIDGPVNFKALDDTMNILQAAMRRASSGGAPQTAVTGPQGTWAGERNLGADWPAAMQRLARENGASPQMTDPNGYYATLTRELLGGIRNR